MIYAAKQLVELTRDYLRPAKSEHVLLGTRVFRPFRSYQHAWKEMLYPGDKINPDICSWFYLQKYMSPLIQEYASSYHLEGIKLLKLDSPSKPEFSQFQQLFSELSQGFKIEVVDKEIEAWDYFNLIRNQRFPCIEKMRSHQELFCANEPDFWHEAIGHIAPLCFKEVQEFYLEVADYLISAKSKQQFNQHLAVAWTLMEYGFLKEQGQSKMFGAALVGSHLANIRYRKGLICTEQASRKTILESSFFLEKAVLARNEKGQLRFFELDQLTTSGLFETGSKL